MMAVPLGATRVEEALRAVRALGAHRYVAARAHFVHALALGALAEPAPPGLADARRWAGGVLANPRLDAASRDERLWRRCSDAELSPLLAAYWTPGERATNTRDRLRELLERHGCETPVDRPFDESLEEERHPLLVDAGWELLPLSELDPERHRGAIAAFGDALSFESARFEEETAVPPRVALCELPALGFAELTAAVDATGALEAPLVVWVEGHETYLDYVLRGVRRAAKLPDDAT